MESKKLNEALQRLVNVFEEERLRRRDLLVTICLNKKAIDEKRRRLRQARKEETKHQDT